MVKGFGSRGATRVASLRSCKKLPPYLIKPVPASSKMDPPLAKAAPISNSGSASGIMQLSGGGTGGNAAQQQLERSNNM